MKVVGVDPGAKGALVCLKNGQILDTIKLDKTSIPELSRWVHMYKDIPFCVEDVQITFGDGVKSAFSFGKNVGKLHAILELHEAEILWVSPQKWANYFKKEYGSSSEKDNKLRNENWTVEHMGDVLREYRDRKRIHSGIVDAYLIARYFEAASDILIKEQEKKSKTKVRRGPKALYI